MKLTELAKILDKQLEMHFPDSGGNWYCSFSRCEIMSKGMLTSQPGRGKTPDEAIADYVDVIVGKRIVFNAMRPDDRVEFVVPDTLDLEVYE